MKYFIKKGEGMIYDIERFTKFSWATCLKYCNILVEKGYLIKKKKNEYKMRVSVRKLICVA